jgi:hypothetical protein
MYQPGWWLVLLLLGVGDAGLIYIVSDPARLSQFPFLQELIAVIKEIIKHPWEIYSSIFDNFKVFAHEHLMEVAGGYGLLALWLLSRRFRNPRREVDDFPFVFMLRSVFLIPALFVGGLIVAKWGIDLFHFFGGGESGVGGMNKMRREPGAWLGNLVGNLVLGIPLMLFGLVVVLVIRAAVYVIPPVYALIGLFVLPDVLWTLARITLSVPFFLWRSLHYVFVPHPAEAAYKRGMAQHLPTTQVAQQVAEALSRDLGNIPRRRYPAAWVSRNREKRIKAFADKVTAGSEFMEEVKRNMRLRDEVNL